MLPKSQSTAETVLAGPVLTAKSPTRRHYLSEKGRLYAISALRYLDPVLERRLDSWPFRLIGRWKEWRTLPGVCTHYAARKEQIFKHIQQIAPQRVVVLGAGLDGLSHRLSGSCQVIEVDLPEIQERKRKLLEHLGTSGVEFISADLSKPGATPELSTALRDQTVVVAEGLLMYFDAGTVASILESCRRWAGSCVVTMLGSSKEEPNPFSGRRGRVDRMLAEVREPFQWTIPLQQVSAFFEQFGWSSGCYGARNKELADINFVSGMIAGEWIVVGSPAS